MTPIQVRVGDVAEMRKAHPCGGVEWDVTRVGADIGLMCRTCGRRVMLARDEFERRLKTLRSNDQSESGASESCAD